MKAVLLDIDGTLVDSNDAHAGAWRKALLEQGFDIEFGVLRRCIGMGGDHMLPRIAGLTKDSALGKKISERRGEIFREEFLPDLKLLNGAKELLEKLLEKKLTLVIATSASSKDGSAILKKFGLDELVHHVTNSSDADKSKPDPDIVLAALKKANLDPSDAVMLGDTPYDIEAAVRAGVVAYAFTSGGWRPEELTGAKKVFSGPADMLMAEF